MVKCWLCGNGTGTDVVSTSRFYYVCMECIKNLGFYQDTLEERKERLNELINSNKSLFNITQVKGVEFSDGK